MKHDEASLALLADLQTRLIVEVFRRAPPGRGLVLKGGMALRQYGSIRHTADTDMHREETMSQRTAAKVIGEALDACHRGLLVNVRITAPKQTDSTQRWKLNGTDPVTARPLHMKVDLSAREHPGTSSTTVLEVSAEEDDPTQLAVYTIDALASHKVACLLDEQRTRPRDVYDVVFLGSLGAMPDLGWAGDASEAYTRLLQKLELITPRLAMDELFSFLPADEQREAGDSWWESVRAEAMLVLERWTTPTEDDRHGESADSQRPTKGPKR
jgi:predicted nucleotidyltransferase component of viral defense system